MSNVLYVNNLEKQIAAKNQLIAELRQQLAAAQGQVTMLRDALWNQLNDCINFNGGRLTTCIMEASTEALASTDDLKEQGK